MNVVVDVGNTRVKYAFFDGAELLESGWGWDILESRLPSLKTEGGVVDLLLAGSGDIPEQNLLLLKSCADFFVEASSQMALPIELAYRTPETLGFDRIANCIGAIRQFPGRALLVIDSGTCITFNYVTAEGVFRGGNISPGVEMRFKSLHHYTAKLPCLTPVENYGGVGQTTQEAIQNGVMSGVLFELKSYIASFLEQEALGKVVITGGNACFFETGLSEDICFCPELGLMGLNEVLRYVKNDN